MENLKIELIDTTMQARCATVQAVVDEYAELMKNGVEFPPVKVACAGAKYYATDGIHRIEAAKQIKRKTIRAIVTSCSLSAAWKAALGSNANHGLRRSNEDKQHALQVAWEHRRELFGENDPTANWLATTCAVSNRMAEEFYAEITARCGDMTPQRQNENGRVYTIPQRPVRPTRPTVQQLPTAPVRPTASVATAPVAQAPARPAYLDNDGVEHFVPTDCNGIEIPTGLQAAFDDKELHRLVQLISEARCLFKRETDAGNLAFAAVRQDALLMLDNAYNFTKAAAPHCVCIMCQGHGCKECGSRGWQTKEQFERSCGAHPECAKWAGVQS